MVLLLKVNSNNNAFISSKSNSAFPFSPSPHSCDAHAMQSLWVCVWCHVFISTSTLPVSWCKGDKFPHDLWVKKRKNKNIYTDSLQHGSSTPTAHTHSLSLTTECVLKTWYSNFRSHQPNKFDNVLTLNMWLHLTSVSLPINSLQFRFFRGKRNAWHSRA